MRASFRQMFFLVLLLSAAAGMSFAGGDFQGVENNILGKANVANLQIRSVQGKIYLEGEAVLLKDKLEAARIAARELQQQVVNNITLPSTGKRDEEISLDVAAKIRSRTTRNYAFNNLSVSSHNGNVILSGKVRDAYLYDLAEEAAAKVAGVQSVVNQIKILPVSSTDDRLRIAIYRRLSSDNRLFTYFLGARPSMDIIVEHGHVTLNGAVNTELDRVVAASRVRELFGVLSVDNRLQVQ